MLKKIIFQKLDFQETNDLLNRLVRSVSGVNWSADMFVFMNLSMVVVVIYSNPFNLWIEKSGVASTNPKSGRDGTATVLIHESGYLGRSTISGRELQNAVSTNRDARRNGSDLADSLVGPVGSGYWSPQLVFGSGRRRFERSGCGRSSIKSPRICP